LRGDRLALNCRIQEIGEGMRGVEFSGLGRLKGKDLLRVSEEMYAIRRHRPMTTSFPLNKVDDELRDLGSPDNDKAIWVFDSFFSHGEGDLNDKLGDPFEEDRHQGQLTEDRAPFESSDLRFKEDIEVFFSGTIDSF
jgi:hypothetical protein